jgi:hypothetical protein
MRSTGSALQLPSVELLYGNTATLLNRKNYSILSVAFAMQLHPQLDQSHIPEGGAALLRVVMKNLSFHIVFARLPALQQQ